MDITRLSIERPIAIIVFYILITLLGIYTYSRLNYELVPRFTPEVITVATVYPGAGPESIEDNISKPIEDALSSVENVDVMVSTSRDNFSLVRLELVPGTDVDLTVQDVQRKIAAIAGELPDDARTPSISRFDFDDLPVMRVGMSSTMTPVDFSRLARDQIVPALSRLEGVAEVRLLGGREKEVRVDVDNDKLNAYGLTILQVIQAIRVANTDVPIGTLSTRGSVRTLKFSGQFGSVDEIRNTPIVHPRTRVNIPLKDVADIFESIRDQRVISRVNGKSSLGLDIKKRGGANAVEMSKRVSAEVQRLTDEYREQQLAFTISQDTSEFTLEAANAVMKDLGFAIFLVSLVMLLFLHSFRNSLIVLLSIPTSILTTFIFMFVLGYSLNLLSLLGLSLAIGILVDDSIVVLENIYRHFEMGKNRVEAAYEGRMEIGFTAVSITLIDVVVFLPIIFSSGLVADLLRQFSVVILISTLMSLLVSFTLAPLLVSRFGKLEVIRPGSVLGRLVIGFEGMINAFSRFMSRLLQKAMDHRIVTLSLATVLLTGSIYLIFGGFIGIEFIKGGDRGEFLLELELPSGTSLDKTDKISRLVEGHLAEVPEITGIFTTVGITSSGRVEVSTENLAELSVKLIDKRRRTRSAAEIARQIKLDLESVIPGVRIRPIDINILGLRDDDAVQVSVATGDTEKLYILADQVEAILGDVLGVVEVTSTAAGNDIETRFVPDRDLMQSLSVNPVYAGATLRTAVNGNTDNNLHDEDSEIPIHIQLQRRDKADPAELLDMSVINEKGQPVKLKQFITLQDIRSPGVLERTNRTPSVTIKSQVIGRTGGQVNQEFRQKLNDLENTENVYFIFGGQTKRTLEGLSTMLVAFAASILLVYFVLVVLYNSFVYPLVVLFSIPMALIGALLALALTMEALSIFSILGLVMLVGLVGKNAILVVDFTIRLQQDGMEMKKALIEATRLRFRPVLMTNLSMIIGLIPIALAAGAGSEWKNGLAWVIIGGLSSSMLLTLIIVPVVYTLFAHRIKDVQVSEAA